MTTDDNQKLRQLLDMTAALISSMDVARRSHTETDRMAWVSYKVFATRYMAIIHQLPQDFPALVVLNPYNTSDMPEPSGSVPSYQRPIFEGVYTDLSILRSILESIIGTAGDERRALTDFFQSRLRAAMMERPENEKAVQDTVEALLVGRGLQKGQEYDRETGRVKLSSKESIPDFILPPFEEAIEVKLVKDRRRVSEVIEEINADIEGLIGGSVIGMGTPYVETNQLGVTNSEAVRRDGVAICGFGSQMVPIFFGQGIEFRLLRDPQETGVQYSLQVPMNYLTVNPLNATGIAQL